MKIKVLVSLIWNSIFNITNICSSYSCRINTSGPVLAQWANSKVSSGGFFIVHPLHTFINLNVLFCFCFLWLLPDFSTTINNVRQFCVLPPPSVYPSSLPPSCPQLDLRQGWGAPDGPGPAAEGWPWVAHVGLTAGHLKRPGPDSSLAQLTLGWKVLTHC